MSIELNRRSEPLTEATRVRDGVDLLSQASVEPSLQELHQAAQNLNIARIREILSANRSTGYHLLHSFCQSVDINNIELLNRVLDVYINTPAIHFKLSANEEISIVQILVNRILATENFVLKSASFLYNPVFYFTFHCAHRLANDRCKNLFIRAVANGDRCLVGNLLYNTRLSVETMEQALTTFNQEVDQDRDMFALIGPSISRRELPSPVSLREASDSDIE